MRERLVIYLHQYDLEHPSWVVMNADGSVRQSQSHANADELRSIASGKEVVVIVPAEDVLLTSAKLPKLKRARLLQALPYAVEEQLIEDVDKLHFALADSTEGEAQAVAIVSKHKMQAWLDLLSSWGIDADALIPASLALPLEAGVWHAAVQEMVVMRTGTYQGFAGDAKNIAELITIALTSTTDRPQQLMIHYCTNQVHEALEHVSVAVKEENIPLDEWIELLAKATLKTPSINLLQSPYAPKKVTLTQVNPVMKTLSGLVMVFLFLLFCYPLVSYVILKKRVETIDVQIAQIYQDNFPQSKSIVAPKLRMNEKLQKLEAKIGENRLLLLLGYVGKGMTAVSGVQLKRFEFQTSQLTLELSAANSDDFSSFTTFLTQHGLQVKQQNATMSGERMNATLQVE